MIQGTWSGEVMPGVSSPCPTFQGRRAERGTTSLEGGGVGRSALSRTGILERCFGARGKVSVPTMQSA